MKLLEKYVAFMEKILGPADMQEAVAACILVVSATLLTAATTVAAFTVFLTWLL